MNVLSLGKGPHQQRIFAKVGHQPQFDLGVIRGDKQISRRRNKRRGLPAECGLDRNICRFGLVEDRRPVEVPTWLKRVDAGFRVGQQRQRVHVVGLELGQLPVLQHLAWNLVMLASSSSTSTAVESTCPVRT